MYGMLALLSLIGALLVALPAYQRAGRAMREQHRLAIDLEQRKRETHRLKSEVSALVQSVATLRASGQKMHARLERTQGELRQVSEAAPKAQSSQFSAMPERVLESAIRQVRDGAEPAALVAHFGLSTAEAELIAKLHRLPSH